MTDLEWAVRDIDLDEEIPVPDQWPDDELDPDEEGGEHDGAQG
jgi:hypothetical protein